MLKKLLMLKTILLACLLSLGLFTGCASDGPTPGKWLEESFTDVKRGELEPVVRAILQQKLGYRVINWQEFPAENLITFETEWNDRDVHLAVFSGTGVRRKVWIEIEDTLRDDDAAAKVATGRSSSTVVDPKKAAAKYETVDGKRLRVVAKLSLSAVREKNVSIVYSAQSAEGDWKEAGDDEEEGYRLISEIRDAVYRLTGRTFGPSEKGEAIHRKYFEKSETPENWTPERSPEKSPKKD